MPTYERWSRPIELDADLRRVYPNHRKAKGKPPAHANHGRPADKGPKGGKGPKGEKGGKGDGHGNGKGKH